MVKEISNTTVMTENPAAIQQLRLSICEREHWLQYRSVDDGVSEILLTCFQVHYPAGGCAYFAWHIIISFHGNSGIGLTSTFFAHQTPDDRLSPVNFLLPIPVFYSCYCFRPICCYTIATLQQLLRQRFNSSKRSHPINYQLGILATHSLDILLFRI